MNPRSRGGTGWTLGGGAAGLPESALQGVIAKLAELGRVPAGAGLRVRLVKGAYWDTESVCPDEWLADFPVWSTKAATDLNYLVLRPRTPCQSRPASIPSLRPITTRIRCVPCARSAAELGNDRLRVSAPASAWAGGGGAPLSNKCAGGRRVRLKTCMRVLLLRLAAHGGSSCPIWVRPAAGERGPTPPSSLLPRSGRAALPTCGARAVRGRRQYGPSPLIAAASGKFTDLTHRGLNAKGTDLNPGARARRARQRTIRLRQRYAAQVRPLIAARKGGQRL